MTKSELDTLLRSVGINSVIEGEGTDGSEFPRINYWEYVWSPISSSGNAYEYEVTYQISFFSKTPRDSKLIDLIKAFASSGVIITVQHELVTSPTRMIHSFFSVDVSEKLY